MNLSELSYLKENEQFMLLESMEKEVATPSLSKAQSLIKLSREGKLTQKHGYDYAEEKSLWKIR